MILFVVIQIVYVETENKNTQTKIPPSSLKNTKKSLNSHKQTTNKNKCFEQFLEKRQSKSLTIQFVELNLRFFFSIEK